MKIKSIDIAGFGKFKNYHLDFPDNMTLILGENENGKSTIMAFLRMMFYGNTGKASGIDKNPRKKYRPWNGDIMAGSVTFSFKGNLYRLEREFKNSNSTDKISLIDLATNERKTLSGSEDIGARFFGLTDGAFDRSVFLSDTGVPAKNESAEGEINARLSNIVSTGDEDVSFEKVGLRLLKAKEALISKSRKVGKLDKALAELSALDEQIKAAEEKEAEIDALRNSAQKKEEELKTASAESARLFGLLKNADKIKKRIFVKRYIDAETQKQKFESILRLKDGNIADLKYVNTAKELKSALSDAEKRKADTDKEILQTEAEIKNLNETINQISADDKSSADEYKVKCEQLDNEIAATKDDAQRLTRELEELKPIKKVNPLFLALGAVFASAGILYSIFTPLIGIGILVIGVILFALGFVLKKSIAPDDSGLRNTLAQNSARLTALLDQKQLLLEKIALSEEAARNKSVKLAADTALLENKRDLLKAEKAEAAELENSRTLAEKALKEHLSLLGDTFDTTDITSCLTQLEDVIREYDGLIQRLGVLADHANCSCLEEAQQKLLSFGDDTDITEAEVEGIKEKFKASSDISGKLRSELASLNAQIKSLTEANPSVAVLQRKRDELTAKIEDYKKYCGAADMAAEVLEEAFRELRMNYSGALDTRTAEIFAELTGNKYKNVNVSKNFELNFTTDEAFGLKESAYLSSGTEDQLYLALRLAITELITAETEELPIFMDDPLCQYDDRRAQAAMEFLKRYSADRQLIMFTCHGGIANIADKLGIKTATI